MLGDGERKARSRRGARGGQRATLVLALATVISTGVAVVLWRGLEASGPQQQRSWSQRWFGAAGAAGAARTAPADGDVSPRALGGHTGSRAAGARSHAAAEPGGDPTTALADAGANDATDAGLARDALVSGRVVDVSGGAVAGARVSVAFEALLRRRFRARASVADAVAADVRWLSDDRGEFRGRVPTGPIYLEASAESYAAAREMVLAPAAGLELVLTPASRIEGRVESETGRPLGGARVEARRRGDETLPLQVRTDEQGRFSVGNVRSGIVELTASAEGFAPGRQWVRLNVAEVSSGVLLRLAPARSVHGRVLVAGRPCRAGLVRAAGPLSPTVDLEPGGRYRIDGLPEGRHELGVFCTGAASRTASLAIGPDSPDRIELNWDLDTGASLTGTLRRSDGSPVSGATLRVYPMAPPPGAKGAAAAGSAGAFLGLAASECTSDAAGAFACGGLGVGYYRVGAEAPGSPGVVSEPFAVEGETPPPLDLVLADGGTLRVRINRGPNAAGIAFRPVARGESGPGPFVSRADGADFVFDGLRLGRYRVGLTQALDVLGPGVVDVTLSRPGEVIELELTPPEALVISGRVVDQQAEPVPDAWIEAWPTLPLGPSALDGIDPVLTDLDGRFEVPALAPGNYVISVQHPRGEARQVGVAAGRRDLGLVLDAYGSLSGSVTLAEGQPAGTFSVLLMRESHSPLRLDGARGRWHAPWVAAGEYRVLAVAATGGASGRVRVEPGRDSELALELDPALAGAGIQNAAKNW